MGIVAHCPNGHRVKVKDELAGRKGVCPQCQATFRIPRSGAAADARAGRDLEPAMAAVGLPVARVLSLEPDVVSVLPRAERVPAAVVHKPRPKVEHEHHHHAKPHRRREHTADHQRDLQPERERGRSETAGPRPAIGAEPAPRPAPGLHPAIAERPDLTWSVAVPGGEASPPLSAEALQQWLDSGAATGDELVWRADWTGWVSIRLVFPDHLPAAGQAGPLP